MILASLGNRERGGREFWGGMQNMELSVQVEVGMNGEPSAWQELPLSAWSETCETLHRWTQIVGKIRMTLTPLVNHWWNVTLYVTSRGLASSAIPYRSGS